MNKNIILVEVLVLFFLIVISGCTSTNNTSQRSIDEDNELLSEGIQANKTSIQYFLGDGSILGTNCRIKVIGPLAKEYGIDQPAAGMKIPLSQMTSNLSIKSDLQIQWVDENNNRKIDDSDMLEVTTISENELESGEWIIKVISKNKGEIIHISDSINIS